MIAPLDFRVAITDDLAILFDLVNSAYRPPVGQEGWTHENALVAGLRIDSAGLQRLLQTPASEVWLACRNQAVLACVHWQRSHDVVCLGMLATWPLQQAQGLASALLAYIEVRAKALGVQRLQIVVLARPELLAFYQRRGFHPTGEIQPYPKNTTNRPRRDDLLLAVWEKRLTN